MTARLLVLVADDDPLAREYFARTLEALGAKVGIAADGPSALEALRARRFDLVIADLRMPGFGAEGLLDASTPVLAVSGELDGAERARLLGLGVVDAHQKPVAPETLRALLERLGAPVLDDDAALRALGSSAALAALRELFARELPQQLEAIRDARARHDRNTIGGILHKLRAGCGFCGLPALHAAIAALDADSEAAWPRFEAEAKRTLEALSAYH